MGTLQMVRTGLIRLRDPWQLIKLLVLGESIATVWVSVQSVRYVAHYVSKSTAGGREAFAQWVPSGQYFAVEVPAVVIGLLLSYLLVYRLARRALGFRDTFYGRRVLEQALFLSSALLLAMSVLGLIEWALFYGGLLPDFLVLTVIAGVLAVATFRTFWKSRKSLPG